MSPNGNDDVGNGDMTPESNISEPNEKYKKTQMVSTYTYTIHEKTPFPNFGSSSEANLSLIHISEPTRH
eukprot:110262-Karenia_brevis.AAC.1